MGTTAEHDTNDYLEGLMEGFVAYDGDWRMTYMNAAAERMLHRNRADVLGKIWHQAFPHAVGNPVDQMYQRVMRSRRGERMEYYYAHYGLWMEISASPLQSRTPAHVPNAFWIEQPCPRPATSSICALQSWQALNI